MPGAALDASVVAGFVTDAAQTPAACTDKKDKKRAKKIAKQMKVAKKKLEKAASARNDKKRQKQLKRAKAKLRKARNLTDRFASKVSPTCHLEILGLVEESQAQARCLQ